ncbi:MAG: NAD(P)-dependent oxidoreductase [Methanomicrobiales archaeon]|nr:NAD(P)-dependent oxidoreductase [Methanomicrobiales archaeon]
MNILLLGAGYLGTELLGFLPDGDCITVLDHGRNFGRLKKARSFDQARMQLFQGDLLDSDLVERLVGEADVVINLTGGGGNAACERDPARSINTYIIGMERLVRLAERSGVDHFYLSSSISVYPSPPPGEILRVTEATPPGPSTLYGILKLSAERILEESDLDYTIIRLSSIYGSTDLYPAPEGGLFGHLLRALSDGEPLAIDGDGTQTIDYVHIRDVCRCIRMLVSKPSVERSVFNAGSGTVKQINEIATTIIGLAREKLDCSPRVVHRPAWNRILNYPLMSIDLIQKTTGWSPEIGMEQGLGEMLAAYARFHHQP